jgi:hypothetical protein
MKISTSVIAKAAAGFVLTAGLIAFTPAQASADCQHDTDKADRNLHEAIAHHGADSKEAQKYRAELAEVRQRCWEKEKRWWDSDTHQWRTEHWDEHDHDH